MGSGALGICIAREFLNSPYKVIVLESGGKEAEEATTRLYDSEVCGLPHSGVHDGRARVFGGTTTPWRGGQALRLDPLDFQVRSWIPFRGWPISLSELTPFYERAERCLQLAALLLTYAIQANPNGIVLFSTTKADRIIKNAASVAHPIFSTEQLARFRKLGCET